MTKAFNIFSLYDFLSPTATEICAALIYWSLLATYKKVLTALF